MISGWNLEILGLVAATLTTGGLVPQAIKVWRTRSAGDLSLITYLMIWVGTVLWLIYASIIASVALLYANAAAFVLVSVILYFKLRYR
jgi:MtN3 and saliva related transmembrane protein